MGPIDNLKLGNQYHQIPFLGVTAPKVQTQQQPSDLQARLAALDGKKKTPLLAPEPKNVDYGSTNVVNVDKEAQRVAKEMTILNGLGVLPNSNITNQNPNGELIPQQDDETKKTLAFA